MTNKKQKPYLEFAGNAFYINVDSILEVIKIDPPIDNQPPVVVEKPTTKKGRPKKNEPVKEVISQEDFENFFGDSGLSIQIDISKWEIIRLMIEALMNYNTDVDDKLGIAGLNNNSTIPFKIAFNTLLRYNILQEEE